MTLENRTVVIAGASGGIGSQLVADLGHAGANLALLEREPAKLASLVQSLGLQDRSVFTHPVDLLDGDAARSAAGAVLARYGRVDALIHVVGGWVGGKTLVDTPAADVVSMLNQHVWTTFNALQAFVPHLVANQWGRILAIGTPAATRPNAKGSAYAAGKAGQEALMLTLSQELKGTGVTANLLLVRTIDNKREKVSSPKPENSNWSTPEELSSVVQFFLSDAAATINGAKLPVFGSYG
ncbi:MAG: SDR family NAD(P)-dependent oxidoreductase [Nitrososphaerales archaeon]